MRLTALACAGALSVICGSATARPAGPLAVTADPVIAAAGDIACDPTNSNFKGGLGSSSSCRQKYTSDLLVNTGLSAVLLLGDNQYYCGGYTAFVQSYDLSWGRVKSITRPAVGNHEYLTSGGTDCNSANQNAAGYYRYFGAAAGDPAQGYYSYDIGSWHLIALNSQCSTAGGCGSTSAQGQWLRADLAAHTNFCTLAYWHIPLFSSGGRANNNTRSFWDALYAADADVVLTGHDHTYERFAPQTPTGLADPVRGIRQWVVGTGGANHTSFTSTWANSEVRDDGTFGVLRLTLHPTSYDWQFVPEAGATFTDSGTGVCHGNDTTPPPPPPAYASFYAYDPAFSGGVRVAAGDVSGDARADIVTAAGAGGGPHVKVFDGVTGQTIRSFFAYPGFSGGVFVAAGDVNGDSRADIITAPGAGGGPHVKVFDGVTLAEIASFYAYHPAFGGGVRVAAGDVNGDSKADIITAPGAGGGPHVKVFDGVTGQTIRSFFAYDPGFDGGVFVAAGNVGGDSKADIITAPGAGGGPHVKVFNGGTLAELASFFAYDPAFGGGVQVAAGDVNGDSKADIITGPGAGGGPHVQVFNGASGAVISSFFAYAGGFTGGVFVAGGKVTGDSKADVVTAPGATGGPHVKAFSATTVAS